MTVEVSRHEALARQFHAVLFGFDAALAVLAAASIARQAHPKDAAERGRQSARPRYFDARSASLRATALAVIACQGFSYADRRMREAAKGIATCGNPFMWREWNMAHHMVRVVRDLGALAGVTFADGPVSTVPEQASLFAKMEDQR